MSTISSMRNRLPTPLSETSLWDCDKIETFFQGKDLPETLQLDEVTTITNVLGFVDSHLSMLKRHQCNPLFTPYYERLQKLAKLI